MRLLKVGVLLLFAFIGSMLFFVYSLSMNNSYELEQSALVAEVAEEVDRDKIENGIHVRTGLVDAEGLMTVVTHCTSCHSAKLLTQNKMSAERWNETIKWMQETQNLWDLGDNQEIIVKYLTTNYPSTKKGRRAVLSAIEWYELED
jgi:hypothetical protein